jgi:hypothetical protein
MISDRAKIKQLSRIQHNVNIMHKQDIGTSANKIFRSDIVL